LERATNTSAEIDNNQSVKTVEKGSSKVMRDQTYRCRFYVQTKRWIVATTFACGLIDFEDQANSMVLLMCKRIVKMSACT